MEKNVYILRRKTLLEKLKGERGIALFVGNDDSPAQYRDNCYKFRQDSTWLYLFGIDEPHFAATIDLETGRETIYADDVDMDDIIWTGPMPTVAEIAADAGVGNTGRYSRLSWDVSAAVMAGRPVHFVPASRLANALRLSSLLGFEPDEVMSAGKDGCPRASMPLVKALIQMRLCKDEAEIALIDEACTLGQAMHVIARRGIRPGRVEQLIVGEMEGYALAKGWGVSFPTILTQHGEIFHCHSHDCPIEEGRLLLVDAGLEANSHYASDFTRTYPAGGKFTSRQRDIYNIVYECNELAFSMTRPGISYMDVHKAVSEHILEGLAGLGIVKGDPAEMAADGISGLFLPHGLGHNMGLDVHDMEDYGENTVGYDEGQTRSPQPGLGSLRMARVLKAGNVITDEPGIYFIPDLIRQWKSEGKDRGCVNYSKLEEYFSFGGIRLEDDVLVTADGARRLGENRLPISPDDVEAAMAEDKCLNG